MKMVGVSVSPEYRVESVYSRGKSLKAEFRRGIYEDVCSFGLYQR
jgi:hypothetical protein